MALRNAFENLATDAGQLDERQLLEAAVILLSNMVEKMPRVDTADRLLVSHAESSPTVSISAGQTLSTVTTVGGVTQIGGRDAAHAMFAMANIGALHIYNNIVVS